MDIGAIKAHVGLIRADVERNELNITNNRALVDTNVQDITNNRVLVDTNVQDITNNDVAISSNDGDLTSIKANYHLCPSCSWNSILGCVTEIQFFCQPILNMLGSAWIKPCAYLSICVSEDVTQNLKLNIFSFLQLQSYLFIKMEWGIRLL